MGDIMGLRKAPPRRNDTIDEEGEWEGYAMLKFKLFFIFFFLLRKFL